VLEDNVCSANAESAEFQGSNVELRGHDNVVRNNEISDSAGFGIKIQTDGEEYDRGGNVVENNRLSNSAAEAFKIKSEAQQGRMCGNEFSAGVLVDGVDPGNLKAPC
jgi:Right handed beta helix region